jgi:hypothetical protein
MSTATDRSSRRAGYESSAHSGIAPLHAQLEAERDAMERAEQEAVLATEHRAAKVEAAREVLAHEYSFDGEKLSGTDALERGYANYIEALRVLADAAHVLTHIGPDIRHAHRVLADAGVVTEAAPAPVSVRAAADDDLRNLRATVFSAVAGDI